MTSHSFASVTRSVIGTTRSKILKLCLTRHEMSHFITILRTLKTRQILLKTQGSDTRIRPKPECITICRFVVVVHDVLREFRPTISHNVSDVRILLWTRKSPRKYSQLYPWDSVTLSTSNFNRSIETKILIHGFSDMGLTGWVKNFKKHYLDKDDYNIVSVIYIY